MICLQLLSTLLIPFMIEGLTDADTNICIWEGQSKIWYKVVNYLVHIIYSTAW